jgi:hypothetical protein
MALEMQKQFGIARYKITFPLPHKLGAAMVQPDRDQIGAQWPLEQDIAVVGGKQKGAVQGKTKGKIRSDMKIKSWPPELHQWFEQTADDWLRNKSAIAQTDDVRKR